VTIRCLPLVVLLALLTAGHGEPGLPIAGAADPARPLDEACDPLLTFAIDDDDDPIRTVAAWIEVGEPGQPNSLRVAVLVHVDWWVHSLSQHGGGTEGKRTRIEVAADGMRWMAGPFQPVVPPLGMLCVDSPEFAGVVFERHQGMVVWQAPLKGVGPQEISGTITVQADAEFACAAPETHPFVARRLDAGEEAAHHADADPFAPQE